ncbi:glycerophosphodiester phosphodiesterase [Anoxybacillus sp. LAT_35]|uniref:glycerophosphodiester phosphodiesterase family protein n=1 Tax=unclassified Anoxybacillus TaxID=2639704 RepID=UPI001EDBBBDB|nr:MULTISPECIES: glycerophosphodiester phosphodiesterase family protein [unclassified Anoxybacillus]MCG5026072.1 glycerophosphodiester phosphodiesterase [Anoxybacillus flavithermus]MCG6196004.1 glycerophosphodiester phosphodiesterase [Anoxybacillus sp. LAT_38]MCG3084207.1 glycerophosphodiester phosphodiesterase [Anoxybacillus sp. LAT27]MCG6170564.1 glycerophosphodiester phosphodiesterase [Anoxybacillus sp. LAT_11]MCG6174705.1 glycerophosphodiester phosphodiesterase [Anoxybacillus sp. LAT_31]
MYIYAHRGFSGEYPENTMISFQRAYELGVDGIELDIQMTKDGELVVIHDECIERTTDGIGYVKDFSFRQLRQLDAGSWFHPRFAGERIPALAEVLDWLSDQERAIILNIELKNGIINYDRMEEKLLTLLHSYRSWRHHIVCSSFSIGSLYRIHQLDPHVNKAMLVEGSQCDVLDFAYAINVKEIHGDWNFLMSQKGEEASKKVEICVYTVNDKFLLNELINRDVKAVMTDFPNHMIKG